MKQYIKKHTNTNSDTAKSVGNKQASARTILQAYKKDEQTQGVSQLKSYTKSVTLSDDIAKSDLGDWNKVRSKLGGIAKGGDADSKIASSVNDSLKALGIQTANLAMSAHMIPNRLGGAGDTSNVRPWDRAFETGTWETDVEQKFNAALVGKKNKVVDYNVKTTEMTDVEADAFIAKSTVDTEKAKPEHKTNILQIPMKVSASVGGSTLAETTAPIENLI